MSKTTLAYLAVVVAILGWGSLHPVAKGVVPITGSLQVALMRSFIAFVVLTTLSVAVSGPQHILTELRNQPQSIFLFALFSFSLSSLLALIALRWLPAGINSVLNNMGPLWLAVAAAITGHARHRVLLSAGAVVAFAGVLLVINPDAAGAAQLDWRGVALSVTSSVVIAGQAVYGRRILPGRDALAVTALAAGFGTLVLALGLPFAGGLQPIVSAPLNTKLALLYLGIGATSINFVCWSFALQHLPATRAMNLSNLIPPVGVLLAYFFLGEPLTPLLVVGVVVIVVGTWVAQAGALRPSDEPLRLRKVPLGTAPASPQAATAGSGEHSPR